MKRTIALFLTLLMALALCACGGGDTPPTKEELLENAETVDIDRLGKDFKTNVVNAKEKYVGKPFIVPGYVYEITEDGCVLSIYSWRGSNTYFLRANIPAEELKLLNTGDIIRVVGTITEGIETEEGLASGSTFTRNYISMENAHFVEEITEFSGIVRKHRYNDNTFDFYIEVPVTTEEPQKIRLYMDPAYYSVITPGDKVKISGSHILERPSSGMGDFVIDFHSGGATLVHEGKAE